MIRYAIENNRIAHDYLVNYTNAAFIVKEGFKLPEDGLYSGFDAEKQTYDKATWNYEAGGNLTGKPIPPVPVVQQGGPSSSPSGARVRPFPSASTLRLSVVEAAVFALHAGNG